MLQLTQKRLSLGWSKAELARRAKVHPADIGKFENGRMTPYLAQLKRIAKALGIPISEAEGLLKEIHE